MFGSDSLPRWGLLLGRGLLAAPLPRLGSLCGTSEGFAGTLRGRVFGLRVRLVSAAVSTLAFLAPTWRLGARPTLEGHWGLVDFGQPVVQLPFVCCRRLGLETETEKSVNKPVFCVSSPVIHDCPQENCSF